jgi:hypothetical protein
MTLSCLLAILIGFLSEPSFAELRSEVRLDNPFERGFPIQPVQSVLTISPGLLPKGVPVTIDALNRYVGLKDEIGGQKIRVQWSDLRLPENKGGDAKATANYVADLPARTKKLLKLVGTAGPKAGDKGPRMTVTEDKKARVVEVRTGRLGLRMPMAGSDRPPILKVCRLPGVHGEAAPPRAGQLPWLGRSRFLRTGPLVSLKVERSSAGPVFYRQSMHYSFALGASYKCVVTCWAGLDYATVEESISGPASEWMRWEFELEDWPTHIYTAGHGATHKFVSGYRNSAAYYDFNLADIAPNKEFLWLPNYLIWSRFEDASLACFFRSAAGPGGKAPFEPDMFTIFQIRRGEWEDHLWAPKARRPLNDMPWRPWSQQRWWGAKSGTIRVIRNGHPKSGAFIRFSLVPGTRSWGLWMGDSKTLPSPRKGIRNNTPQPSLVKTALGEVRLTEHQHRIIDWKRDPKVTHPRMHVTAEMIASMDAKSKADPYFTTALETLQKDAAFRALITKDKKAAAGIARGVLHDMNTRFNYPLTEGIEFSSHLSPVGVRPVFGHALKIDLLLGADLLEPEIKKQLRERFVYLAYLLTDSMFMAYKYNAGHPNFDADRYIAIAAAAMLYPDHPHAKQWLDHVAGSLREAMRIYVISQSGKWAENLGGYYNWSTNIIGGMAWALKFTNSADPYAWPEFQNFWRWGLVTVLPPKPSTGQLGKVVPGELKRIRLTAGIGDNGGDGGLGVHGGFALAGAGILKHNPELGKQLLWFWNEGGRHGYGHYPHSLFFGLSPEQIKIAADQRSKSKFHSQLLEGYGSLFRADFGKPTESYVLFKSGPGGYRYHGEEGSFVLFGLGQPITLDGSRAWKPHEHSTVTFGEKMLGLHRGRIVQFESTPNIDYACGKFPGSTEQLASAPKPSRASKPSGRGVGSAFKRFLGRPSEARTPTLAIQSLLSPDSAPDSNALNFFAAHQSSDVMTRQLLFRRNDYLVVCDQMNSGLDSEWRQLILAKEIELTRKQIVARGWLGVDVTVSLFQFDQGSTELSPIDPKEVVIDDQPLKQKRLTLKQGPGIGVLALLDFHKAGEKPWRVKTRERSLVLTSPDRKATEIIELRGGGSPSASWQRRQGRQVMKWAHTKINDPWRPASPAILGVGEIFVDGNRNRNWALQPPATTGETEDKASQAKRDLETVFCLAGKALGAQQAHNQLTHYQASIEALRKENLWSMLVLGTKHVSVIEQVGSDGLRYRELNEAATLAALSGRADQAARGRLPKQVALIRLPSQGDSTEMFARRSISQYAGFAVETVTDKAVEAGKLEGFKAAVLWQLDRQANPGKQTLPAIRRFVEEGGTLICDLPSIQGKEGIDTSALLGFHSDHAKPRDALAITHPELGHVELSSSPPNEEHPVPDLGLWDVKPIKGTEIIKDTTGHPAIAIHSLGKGRVITFCFRVHAAGLGATNQVFLARLLQWSLRGSGTLPLVDAPWVEKTIIPQDDGGLLIGAWNPLPVSIGCPVKFPHHPTPVIKPIYAPIGGSVDPSHIVLPGRKWIVFGVR